MKLIPKYLNAGLILQPVSTYVLRPINPRIPNSRITSNPTITINNRKPRSWDRSYVLKINNTEEQIDRALQVARYLLNNGFSRNLAIAQAAIYLDENGCDPKIVMGAEKAGKGVEGTRGSNEYGAGFGSWTGAAKTAYLEASGYPADTKVENMSLEDQCKLIINASNNKGPLKYYYDVLKKCQSLEDAVATAYFITGGIGHYKNWPNIPTQQDAIRVSDTWGSNNNASYGNSDYHKDSYLRRYKKAKLLSEIL